jgi:polyhydroxyalkanoate synthesis regulator phasin
MKKTIAAVAAIAILAAGAVAFVGLVSGDAIAQEDAVEEETAERIFTPLTDALDELVREGVINQDQADAVAEKLEDTFPARRGIIRHRIGHLRSFFDELGLDPAEVMEQLQDGATIADMAEANGIDVDGMIDAAVASATDRVQALVDRGRMDQETADEKLAELEERLTDLVNGDYDELPFGRRGFHHRGPFGADTEDAGD